MLRAETKSEGLEVNSAGLSSGGRARGIYRVLAGVLTAALAVVGLIAVATPASAVVVGGPGPGAVSGYDSVFYVNDLRNRATGTVISLPAPPGTATPVQSLTLFDAIQQANALPAGERILITVADQVWVPNQTADTPPKWVSPSNAATPAGSWQTGTAATPLLVKVLEGEDPGFATSVGSTAATEMLRGAAWTAAMGGNTTDFDSTVWGSRYYISHNNVTLDLQKRIGFNLSSDTAPPGSMFAIGGDNVTLRNIASLAGGESGIVISAFSDGTTIENSSLSNPSTPVAGNASSTYAIERAIEIFEGSSNTTIRNTTFDRNYYTAVNLLRATTRGTVSNLTLDGIVWKQTVSASTDLAANYLVATGSTYASVLAGANTSGLKIQNSTISDWCADSAGGNLGIIDLEYSTHANAVISGNTFSGSKNCALNVVKTFQLGTGSSIDIRNNTFRTSAVLSSDYIYSWIYIDDVLAPAATNTTNIKIHDNTFSGGSNSALVTMDPYPVSRVLSVYRNTMSGIGGLATAAVENGLHVENPIYTWNVNNQIRTAFPAPGPTVTGCNLSVNVVSPFYGTGGNMPTGDTLWVDVYAGDTPTNLNTYVGRIVANAATLQAAGASGQPYSLPYTGTAGYVRMQTMLSDSNGSNTAIGQTSNISRSMQMTGSDTCPPQMWVKQGGWFNANGTTTVTQSDPTSNRFVNFEIASSELINAGQLTPSDISFAGTAPNQQVVSLTQVSPTRWQLVAKAGGSGTIVPVIAAGSVADPTGNVQDLATNSTQAPVNFAGYTNTSQTTGIPGADVDRSVTYVSPLVLTKASTTVAEAPTAPVSDSFGIGYLDDSGTTGLIKDAGGRIITAPTNPLQVCLTNGSDTITGDAALTSPAPNQTITGAATVQCAAMRTTDATGDAVVTAVDNLVVDGARTANSAGAGSNSDGSNAPTFVVQSDDPQFDGLILGPASGYSTSLTVNDNDRPDATKSQLALTTDGAQADGSHVNQVTATVKNTGGALVSNAPVTFDIPSGVVWVGPDGTPGTADDVVGGSGVTATVVTNAAGTALLSVTSSAADVYDLHARVNTSEEIAASPKSVTFVALSVDLTNPGTGFTVSTGDQVANGTAEHTITVTLRTTADTPATGLEGTLGATAAPGTGVVVGSFVETATPGQYTAKVTSTLSGVKTIAVTFDDGTVQTVPLISAGSATASFVAGPPVVGPGFSVVTIDDSSNRLADGIAFHTITTVLTDGQGNRITGAAGRLTSSVAGSPASVTVTALVESSTNPGTYTALVRSTSSGAKDVTITVDGTITVGTVAANFAAGPVDLGNSGSAYSVSTGTQVVGAGSHTVTVTLADANGNPVSGQSASLVATTAGSLGTGSITGFTEIGSTGSYTATITSTSSGSKAISVRLSGSAVTLSGNGDASFVAAAVDLGNAATSYTVSGGDVVVGVGQHAVTIRLADQYGNPVAGQVANLDATTADSLGGGAIAAFAETGVPGTYQALITSTVSGGKTIEATFGGDAVTLVGNDVATFVPAGVDVNAVGTRYTVTTGNEIVGTGSHTITVTLSDSLGNPVPDQESGLEATTLDPLGTGTITAFNPTGAPGEYEAIVTSSVAGPKTIVTTFGADKLQVLAAGNNVASFVPAPVDLSAGASGFFVSPGSVLVGTGQHSVTVHLEDSLGNPISGRQADLIASPATSLGTGSITGFTETSTLGTYRATISSTIAGAKSISVTLSSDPVLADGNSVALFNAGLVDLAASGSAYSVSGGSVSVAGGTHEITVTLTDQFGNPVAAQAALLQGATSDALGGGAIGNFVEGPTGTYTASITSTVAGNKTISVTLSGAPVALSGNGIASFVSGGVDLGNAGTRYSVTTGTQPVGSGSHTITVTLADADGNPVANQAAGLLAGHAEPIGGGAISGFTETGTPGTYTATVSSTLSGDKNITVTFGGSPVVLSGSGIASFVAGAVDPGNAGSGYSVSGGQVSVVGGAHQITATLADQYGNPVSGQSLLLAGSSTANLGTGSVTGFVEVGTTGTYTATITSSVTGDKPIETAFDANALTLRGNGTARFISGGVDTGNAGTGFSVSTGNQLVGSGTHTITVTLADQNGNPVAGQAGGISANASGGLGLGSILAFTESGTPGTYTASMSSTSSGSKTITVDFGGSAVSARGNDVAVFVAGAPDLTNTSTNYSVSVGSVSVSGGSHTVLVSMADQFGNPVSGLAAGLSAASSGGLGSGSIGGFVEVGTSGTYTATVTSSIAGTKAITAAYNGSAITATGNSEAVFSAGAVDVGSTGTRFSVSSGNETVSTGSHTVTVTLSDADGNAVGGQAALLQATSSNNIGAGTISAFTESATTPGTYTAAVSSTLAGGKTIAVLYGQGVVSVDGEPITAGGNVIANFIAGGVDLANSNTAFSVSTGNQAVGTGSHTVTVLLADQFGNPVSGQASQLQGTSADGLGTGTVSVFAETATPGTYTTTVNSTIAGSKAISVTFTGSAVTAGANANAVFIAGAPDISNPGSKYSVSTGTQPVSTGSHTVTVTVADSFGNPVTGQSALLAAATADQLGTGTLSGFVETGTLGTYTASVTSTISGGKSITVGFDGNAMTASGNTTASFAAGAVDLGNANTRYVVSGGSVLVSTASHLITARLADQFGNPVGGQAGQLTAATVDPLGTGSISAFIETATPGTYEATVSSSNAGSKNITVNFDVSPVTAGGNAIAVFAPGSADPAAPGTGFAVSTGGQPVGSGSHTITVTLTDSAGNSVSGQAAGLSATVPGIGLGTITGFTEVGTSGTYTATVSSTIAGNKTVSVRFGADPLTASGNVTASFTTGSVDTGNPGTGFLVSGGSQAVGTGSHTVTVTLADQYGNAVPGLAADLVAASTGDLGAGSIGAFTESATPGTYTAAIASTRSGSKPITVTVNGSPVTARGNTAAVFVSGPVDLAAAQLTATSQVKADGKSVSTITLRLFDAFGNPATQQVPVGFLTTLGNVGSVSFNGAGVYTASMTSTRAGTATVSADVNGTRITQTADVVFKDATPPKAPVIDPSDGQTVTGCAEPGTTITVRDASGKVIGTGVADKDCRFTISLQPPQEPGARISVTATDAEGNVSGGASISVGLIWMELAKQKLQQGGTQVATGHSFQPGETVSAVLRSTPISLGSATADENGDVTFTFEIPADFELGEHSVTLTGSFSGSVSETFTVISPPPLAITGSDGTIPLLMFGIAALLGGFIVLGRRRRETQWIVSSADA